MYKLVTSIPTKYTKELVKAMAEAGAGKVGNYTHCALVTEATGYFKPDEDANPVIGKKNKLNKIKENRIEMHCPEDKLQDVLQAIKNVHPYEEPIIDIYELKTPKNLPRR